MLDVRRVTYGVERAVDLRDEIEPLLEQQWKELAVYSDIPLEPDWEIYRVMDDHNSLGIYTARIEGELIGYAIYFVRLKHHHYSRSSWAVSDILWVHPDFRRQYIGSSLMEFVETELTKRGVVVMQTDDKEAHSGLGLLLRSRGHTHMGNLYAKRLN